VPREPAQKCERSSRSAATHGSQPRNWGRGHPAHAICAALRTTLYSEPAEDTTLRKQFLVVYDTVPGGTGYLKQLVTPSREGGRIPLFEVL